MRVDHRFDERAVARRIARERRHSLFLHEILPRLIVMACSAAAFALLFSR